VMFCISVVKAKKIKRRYKPGPKHKRRQTLYLVGTKNMFI